MPAPLQGRRNLVGLNEISDDDFRAKPAEVNRSLVVTPDECPHWHIGRAENFHNAAANSTHLTSGAGHQNTIRG